MERLGSPVFVHSYYGYIWEKDDAYLTLNFIEKRYNCDVLTIFTLRRIPIGKKLKYDVYKQIEDIIKKEFTEQSLNLDSFIHYHGKQFSCFGVNDNTQCLLILKQHSLRFYYSSKEPFGERMTRVIPRYNRNERISLQDLSSVEQALHNCFAAK